MQTRVLIPILIALGLSACGAPAQEKAILGTWIQETPTSTTDAGLHMTTSDARLEIRKNGDVRLQRLLDVSGTGLPETGVSMDVDLSGQWSIRDGQLVQSLESASVMPRTQGDFAGRLASQVQAQAQIAEDSVKDIIALDRKQLILQDAQSGATDVYRRK